ncbi:hypothetical protein Xbed_00859 [Xenorhabdus beddingii]|uniref:Uncharacterized protein n=1 Tax=Xenorhabdus beddingii TaxID=40578 RepID=A0A1Y2SQ51_9GAMM|nr:hypothetical protein [Xenorhabdus beddingii]OTA21206.1 hypothetical protein Xbed_00859 [Xenorhabdus beddingii]
MENTITTESTAAAISWQAWLHSPYGLKVLTSSLYCDLWENHGEIATQLDNPKGSLESQIEHWLRQKMAVGYRVEKLASQDYLLAMEQEKNNRSDDL